MLDQLADAGVVDLGISGGEPLMREDLFEVIAHARMRSLVVGVGSNGTSISGDRARRLADLGVRRLQLSLDGLAPQHDRLRCWDGLFEKVLRAIDVALEAGLRTHVCCTINRLNARDLPAFTRFVWSLGVHRLNYSRYVPTGRGTDTLDLEVDEWESVVRHVVDLRERYRGRIEITSHLAQQVLVDDEVDAFPIFSGCQAGLGQGCVTADGTVLPCVLLPVPVGNVRERPFAELWRSSPVIRTLRARNGLRGACSRCVHKNRCGGCRAVAFAKTGDFLATDPRCWLPRAANA